MIQESQYPYTKNLTATCTGMLGFLALCFSALDLSAYGMARYLNSDFLTPHFFCLDLLTNRQPLSGWTLSASPYFMPDHLLLGGLMTVFNHTGQAYALFTLIFYPSLFLLVGCCVQNAVGHGGPAHLASLLFGNVFLALRFLPRHALYLWWMGAPCCHGGVLLLGFAYLWVLGRGLRRGRVGWMAVPLFSIGIAGMCSDSLFFIQILLPATFALFICQRRYSEFAPWFRWQGGCTGVGLVVSQLFQPLCRMNDWFYFSRIIRVAPTPMHQWDALCQFLSDQPHLMHDGWGFALLAVVAAIYLGYSQPNLTIKREDDNPAIHTGVVEFYRIFCVASLFCMLPLPVLTCAWRSANNVRYLFNWLVLPGFVLSIAAAEKGVIGINLSNRFLRRQILLIPALIFILCGGSAANDLRGASLQFPYPDDVAALDTLLQRRGLKYGLAQYWRAKYITALSHTGVELRQIRSNGELYFWDNNAFGYYACDALHTFDWPAYQYVLVDLLDEQSVVRIFGEPQEKSRAGRFQVWIYPKQAQAKFRDVLEPAVRAKLGPKRFGQLR